MKTKICKSCNKEIAKCARTCPECGHYYGKPIYKRWWFIILTILVVFTVIILIIPSNSTPETIYQVGDTFDVKDLSVKIVSVSNAKTLGSGYTTTTTEYNYILVTCEITNNSNEPQYINGLTYSVNLYKEESKYNTSSAGMYLDNGCWSSKEIQSGFTETVTFVFEVLTETTEDDYYFEVYKNSSNKARVKL